MASSLCLSRVIFLIVLLIILFLLTLGFGICNYFIYEGAATLASRVLCQLDNIAMNTTNLRFWCPSLDQWLPGRMTAAPLVPNATYWLWVDCTIASLADTPFAPCLYFYTRSAFLTFWMLQVSIMCIFGALVLNSLVYVPWTTTTPPTNSSSSSNLLDDDRLPLYRPPDRLSPPNYHTTFS